MSTRRAKGSRMLSPEERRGLLEEAADPRRRDVLRPLPRPIGAVPGDPSALRHPAAVAALGAAPGAVPLLRGSGARAAGKPPPVGAAPRAATTRAGKRQRGRPRALRRGASPVAGAAAASGDGRGSQPRRCFHGRAAHGSRLQENRRGRHARRDVPCSGAVSCPAATDAPEQVGGRGRRLPSPVFRLSPGAGGGSASPRLCVSFPSGGWGPCALAPLRLCVDRRRHPLLFTPHPLPSPDGPHPHPRPPRRRQPARACACSPGEVGAQGRAGGGAPAQAAHHRPARPCRSHLAPAVAAARPPRPGRLLRLAAPRRRHHGGRRGRGRAEGVR